MEAPTCLRCGTKHYTTQPCPAAIVEASTSRPSKPLEGLPKASLPPAVSVEKLGGPPRLEKPENFDRVAYQRNYMKEYMRKWRARRRVEK